MKLAIATILVVAVIGVTYAYPKKTSLKTNDERSLSQNTPLVVRFPRYFQQEDYDLEQDDSNWNPRARRYRVYKKYTPKRSRDSDEEDEEDEETNDSAADDEEQDDLEEDEEQDDQQQFDTPTWDQIFPPEEQGDYGQAVKQPGAGGYSGTGSSGLGYSVSPASSGYTGSSSPNTHHYQMRRRNFGVPPQEYSGPAGVVGPPAGRGRSGLINDDDDVPSRGRPVAVRVVNPRQYSMNVGSIPRRQNYYASNRRTPVWDQWNSYIAPQPYQTPNRRTWGFSARPGYSYKKSPNSRFPTTVYPFVPDSAYRGRSNSYQGRRNNRIPVFYWGN